MPNENLQTDLKQDWNEREVVMPVHVNDWSSRINKINEIIPTYSATGSFYKCSFEDNTYKLSPMVFADDSQNVAPASYIDGMQVEFKIAETNETNCLVDVNGLGAKTIKNTDNTVVEAETLEKNDYVTLRYDYEQDCFYIVTSASKQSGAALPMFSHFWSDHIYNDVSYVRADNFSWHYAYIYRTGFQILEEEYNHENCVLKTENGITYKLSPNGFKIADVSQQDKIRSLYENTGSAWYYIIDTKNRCFKLPREKSEWELKGTAHVDVAGNGMALGLTDNVQNYTLTRSNVDGIPYMRPSDGYGYEVGTASNINGKAEQNYITTGLTPDPTKSGIGGTVKLSNTIERKNTDRRKYLYFYVGQSKRPETEVNLGQTSEALNNKVDLDAENYKGSELENYVNDTCLNDKRTNCITEIPQRIKYTLVDGVLTVLAGSVAVVPYGTEDLTSQYPVGSTFLHENFKVYDTSWDGEKFFVLVETLKDLSPVNIGANIRMIMLMYDGTIKTSALSYVISGATPSQASTSYRWYDTTTNLIKEHDGTQWNTNTYLSFPFMVCRADGTNFTSVDEVFNGVGYMGSTIWADKGIEGLIADGRNEDRTLKNTEFITPKVLILNNTTQTGEYYLGFNYYSFQRVAKKEYYYDFENNYNKHANGVWTRAPFISCTLTKGVVSNFEVVKPFRAVDYNEAVVKNDLQEVQCVVETYVNGTSWYRVWSDGWIEQGGVISSFTNGAQISLLKPYKNTNYSVVASKRTSSAQTGDYNGAFYPANVSYFITYSGGTTTKPYTWKACGY